MIMIDGEHPPPIDTDSPFFFFFSSFDGIIAIYQLVKNYIYVSVSVRRLRVWNWPDFYVQKSVVVLHDCCCLM